MLKIVDRISFAAPCSMGYWAAPDRMAPSVSAVSAPAPSSFAGHDADCHIIEFRFTELLENIMAILLYIPFKCGKML